MMEKKVDFKKTMKPLYSASAKKFAYIEVPPMKFLMIDGQGNPETSKDFQESLDALYSMAYTLKFMLKDKELQPDGYFDFVVPPLETLWHTTDGSFDENDPDSWNWTCLIMQADYITPGLVEKAKKEVSKKKEIAALNRVRFEVYDEGKALQIMHIGPYNEVGAIYEKIHAEMEAKYLKCSNHAHEIYMNDPRRTKPEKLKTVVRQPYTEK